ncbi:hypothetical protein QFZ54_003744 [Sphingomonas faeni]|nr:hypothetical protein [Sphingomonas faeni]
MDIGSKMAADRLLLPIDRTCGRSHARDVDVAPLQLVTDALLRGQRHAVDAFHYQLEGPAQ